MLRGADRRIIFADDADCARFLEILQKTKREGEFQLYAYCLMGNHVHLVLKEGREPLEVIFKRIGCSYVYYYNWKYELHGHLFQDRYRSEAVEDDSYFLDVLRYVCQNPVKAGLSETPFDYPWLGCSGSERHDEFLDDMSSLTNLAGEDLRQFLSEPYREDHLEDLGTKRLTDREAIKILEEVTGAAVVQGIEGWEADRRDAGVRKGLDAGLSIRQLSRLTGISKAIIERIGKA